MKVLYCAPVRSTHYGYALELHRAGMLQAFVAGSSRFSPRAALPELGRRLIRADFFQNLELAALCARLPSGISDEFGHQSRKFIDRVCKQYLDDADAFLFYSGCGLNSARCMRTRGGISVVETVTSHIQVQEEILRDEYARLGLRWKPFHKASKKRRILEYDEGDRILVPSEFVRRGFLEKGFSPEKLIKIPYRVSKVAGSHLDEMHSSSDKKPFRILYVGSVSPRKGIRYLIEAFSKIRHREKELWIVGPIISPSGLEGISIPEGVIFKGVLKGSQRQSAYLNSSIFCLPTIEDGFGIVLGEALAYGLPVVASRNSGAEDLMTHDREGVITGIRDPGALCSAFERAIQDPDWFGMIRENARLRSIELQSAPQSSGIVEKLSTLIQNPSIP